MAVQSAIEIHYEEHNILRKARKKKKAEAVFLLSIYNLGFQNTKD